MDGDAQSGGANALLRKLQGLAPLSAEDRDVLMRALGPIRTVEARSDIVPEGPTPGYCAILLDGLACRYRTLDDGRRQIVLLQTPGDVLDLPGFLMRRLDHAVGAISRCRIATINHDVLNDIVARRPTILLALWRDSLMEAAVYRAWLVNVGQRSAYERVANLLCELAVRLRLVDRARADSFDFPLTQEELGDTLGLSVVHVNRVLQRLRAEGLITLKARRLTIHDRDTLARAGGFDPRYLQA